MQQSEIQALTEKIAELEKRVVALEKGHIRPTDHGDVIDLSDPQYKLCSDGVSEPAEEDLVIPKRGRPPIIPHAQLAHQRDELVNFIEVRWPDLLNHMRRPKSIEHLLDALKKASPGAQTNWSYIHLTENIGELWNFLNSERYNGEPRKIAYAMAGVPDMEWRSSLNACTKRPSHLPINLPAFKDHIQRNNPKLLRSLISTGATERNLKQLAKHCDECRQLAAKPKRLLQALQEGEPLVV